MKHLFLSLLFLLSTQSFATATYQLDPTHTNIGFKIKHLVITTVHGRFKSFEGSAQYDEKSGKLDSINVSIDANSIDTANEKRDDHLRDGDFFDVKKHPKITFVSKKITQNGKDYIVVGDFTMRGVKKPLTMKLKTTGSAKDPWGNQKVGFEATGELNRKDYGLTWNKALESGGLTVGEEVTLVIDGQAVKK